MTLRSSAPVWCRPARPPAAPAAAPLAAPLAGGGAQPEPAVDPDNDRERARHPRSRPSRDTTGKVRFDRSIENDWHTVYLDGAPRLGFQLTPNHIASDWPDGEPQRLRLDLYVDDIAAGHAEVMALGAHLLKPAAHPEGVEGFQVYADPLGASILPLLGLNGTGAALHLSARE